MLSEEAGRREENTTWWESNVIPQGGLAETLTSHAKGEGRKTAGSGQQLCGWSLDLSKAHHPFRLHLLPNSQDPSWCHQPSPLVLSPAT